MSCSHRSLHTGGESLLHGVRNWERWSLRWTFVPPTSFSRALFPILSSNHQSSRHQSSRHQSSRHQSSRHHSTQHRGGGRHSKELHGGSLQSSPLLTIDLSFSLRLSRLRSFPSIPSMMAIREVSVRKRGHASLQHHAAAGFTVECSHLLGGALASSSDELLSWSGSSSSSLSLGSTEAAASRSRRWIFASSCCRNQWYACSSANRRPGSRLHSLLLSCSGRDRWGGSAGGVNVCPREVEKLGDASDERKWHSWIERTLECRNDATSDSKALLLSSNEGM